MYVPKWLQKRSFPDPRGSSSEKQRRSNIKKASTDRVPYSEEYVNTYSTQNSEKDANEKSEMQLALKKAGIDSETFSGDEQYSIQKLTPEQREAIKSREGLTEEGKLLYNGSNDWTKEGSLYAKRSEEFRRIQEESKRMSHDELESFRRDNRKLNEEDRRKLSRIFERELRAECTRLRISDKPSLTLSGKNAEYNVYENISGELFHDIFEVARQYLRNGELVDAHEIKTTEDGIGYDDCSNYISDDGLSGFSITPTKFALAGK